MGTCSSLSFRAWGVSLLRGAAALAAALLLALGAPSAAFCADVFVHGVPGWLAEGVSRTVSAVWDEMGERRSVEERLKLLDLVCSRLFEGYAFSSAYRDGGLEVRLRPLERVVWSVDVKAGEWREPVDRWLREDLGALKERLQGEVDGVPGEAFLWGRRYLEVLLASLAREMLPGWRLEASPGRGVLEVRAYPSQPLVLAVNPRMRSSTLPAVLMDRVKDEISMGASAFVGLPVEYLRWKAGEAASYVRGLAESGDREEALCLAAKVDLKPAPLGEMDVRVDSRRYVIWAWVAAHAGSDQRSSEGGLHLGRRVQIFPSWDMEAYGEWVLDGRDLSLESRWGLRWQVMRYLWAGVELSYPGAELFFRVDTELLADDFYWYAAWGDGGRRRGGLGRRVSETFSVELYYDSGDEDSLSLKFLNNL
ncbi:hypothetical protein TheveDRAFT_0471 [Thermanaerovibrio velox DSM 12556]|uniref:Uncharacterized protein n=1 Tax=Thermanaerovibrio velox DSM 12556 TaxID=926567 RepID=H0UQ03_9BACT|nr:hypothetical protein [Thermanaerovibrio velox]EHM09632.1 hypothetical protein TheveDRAFT_0471 [Thermanaerovibrio velox DSM 12556]